MREFIEKIKAYPVIALFVLSVAIISPYGWIVSLSSISICLEVMDNPHLGIIPIAIVNGSALGYVLAFTRRK